MTELESAVIAYLENPTPETYERLRLARIEVKLARIAEEAEAGELFDD